MRFQFRLKTLMGLVVVTALAISLLLSLGRMAPMAFPGMDWRGLSLATLGLLVVARVVVFAFVPSSPSRSSRPGSPPEDPLTPRTGG